MKRNKIAHIVNVTEINESKIPSYLHIAQPITLKTMLIAKTAAERIADVELFAIKHQEEKVEIPEGFSWADDIKKYAWEYIDSLQKISSHKPLPRITDIINGLYNASDAEYFIYTNVDIGLFPNFYIYVNELINQNVDSFCINRRTISKEYQGIVLDETNFELCYLQNGKLHNGVDCFVFRRDIVPSLLLNNVFIGFPPVGRVLRSQIQKNSKNFQVQEYDRVTFHLGDDMAWKEKTHPYWIENEREAEGLSIPYKTPKVIKTRLNKYKYWIIQSLLGEWNY